MSRVNSLKIWVNFYWREPYRFVVRVSPTVARIGSCIKATWIGYALLMKTTSMTKIALLSI